MRHHNCLLYTSDAADERSSVDLGGRRIIKKKNDIPTYIGRDYKQTNTPMNDNITQSETLEI